MRGVNTRTRDGSRGRSSKEEQGNQAGQVAWASFTWSLFLGPAKILLIAVPLTASRHKIGLAYVVWRAEGLGAAVAAGTVVE